MLVLDDLHSGTGLYLDDLSEGTVVSYFQQGTLAISMSFGGAQESLGVFEQPLDITVEIYWNSPQEWLPPPAAQGYVQSGTLQIFTFFDAPQEHIPATAQSYTQQGALSVTFAFGGPQSHAPGAAAGEYVQQGGLLITLLPGAEHYYTPSNFIASVLIPISEVRPYFGVIRTLVTVHFADQVSTNQIGLHFDSNNPTFDGGVGPGGGGTFVEIAAKLGGARVPIVSLSKAHPEAVFADGGPNNALFQQLRTALLAGPVEFELGGYESLGARTVSTPMPGSSFFTVRAVRT